LINNRLIVGQSWSGQQQSRWDLFANTLTVGKAIEATLVSY